MLNNCDCGLTCGCEKCFPGLYAMMEPMGPSDDFLCEEGYIGDLVVPESSKWRKVIENELKVHNRKSGFPADYGYFIRK